MKYYMVSVKINKKPDEKFMELLPKQKLKGEELIRLGKMEKLYISKDHSSFWAIINEKDEYKVESIIKELPLYNYISYNIILLDK